MRKGVAAKEEEEISAEDTTKEEKGEAASKEASEKVAFKEECEKADFKESEKEGEVKSFARKLSSDESLFFFQIHFDYKFHCEKSLCSFSIV